MSLIYRTTVNRSTWLLGLALGLSPKPTFLLLVRQSTELHRLAWHRLIYSASGYKILQLFKERVQTDVTHDSKNHLNRWFSFNHSALQKDLFRDRQERMFFFFCRKFFCMTGKNKKTHPIVSSLLLWNFGRSETNRSIHARLIAKCQWDD